MEERLTIDEIIGHCERHTERFETYSSRMQLEETPVGDSNYMKEYWEHRQVAEYLKELKQYRELGPVAELEEDALMVRADRILLDEYMKLGSVEECRKAVEKQKAKKPRFVDTRFRNHGRHVSDGCSIGKCYECPTCRSHIFHVFENDDHCENCGQKLDWREE